MIKITDKPKPLDLEGIKEKILKEFGWDDKTFEEKLEILFGKKGIYKDKDGHATEYPKTETTISIAYLNSIKIQIEDMLSLLQKEIKHRIKQACDFYLRYKDEPDLLIKEHPEFKEKLKKFGLVVELFESISDEDSEMWTLAKLYTAYKHFDWEKYNEWLFRLVFRDVLGEEDECIRSTQVL